MKPAVSIFISILSVILIVALVAFIAYLTDAAKLERCAELEYYESLDESEKVYHRHRIAELKGDMARFHPEGCDDLP